MPAPDTGPARLGLTRVAFACPSFEELQQRQRAFRQGEGAAAYIPLTSARMPRRDLTGGSVFWILKHSLIARNAILGVEEIEGPTGTMALIRLSPRLVPVLPRHCRAHQGWRYLSEADWPADQTDGEPLPPDLAAELAGLSLI